MNLRFSICDLRFEVIAAETRDPLFNRKSQIGNRKSL